ncbi:AsmA-like C-terminal region-containing protein [Methylobacterium brachythecii]|uniref:DUF3971 domain-containing protein n=1 Tax=Methylobacterium brachythecii TaxID=1176177 RepID=A0A7W6AKW5_9HYPH|nr:AsmA-like C-terminal region-containing protein [Methylobacterium brachythecii]MBB3903059.1 hypothetical protein [Methylobacterium brachythecii]GLS45705.1 hypothetical protein GCM10007884_36960 [Methylobacterium brachythecii]
MDQETAHSLLEEAVTGKAATGKPARGPETPPERPRKASGRVRRRCMIGAVLLVFLLGLGTGLAVLRLSQGPLHIEGMSERVAAGLAGSIGPGWRVDLKDSSLELDSENSLALRVAGLDVFNPDGALVVSAPLAVVSIDTWGLMKFSVQPRSIEFRDLRMTALVHRDGSIAFAASSPTETAAVKPHTLPSVDPARGTVSPVSAAVASIFGVVLDSAGVVGALDRAKITNGRLTLIDDDARERAVFERVNGLFRRDATRDARIFELRIDGPHGEWRFGGDVHEEGGGRRSGTITLDDLPVTDMLLLGGMSKLPVETDLKVSGSADVAINAGRIESMKVGVHSSAGNLLIEEKDFNPVTIETLNAAASWDEANRALKLDSLDYAGAGNSVQLQGAFAQSPNGAPTDWTLSFGGSNAVLRGATPADAPVKVAEIKGHLTGREGGISIDEFSMRGEKLNGTITGTIGTSRDDDGVTLRIKADHTEGRLALRLWPEHVAPAVRYYLVDYLVGGQVDATEIVVDLSGAEMASALQGAPLPDKSLHVDVAVSGAGLTVSRDAPPIGHARLTGVITGRSTTINGASADIRLADNRTLGISDGSFTVRDPQPGNVLAQIGLRLGGGADAIAALLQTKMFKGLSGTDFDPANIKGRADLRIDFPLNLKHVPDIADIPVTLNGALTDLTVDKAFGKERFEQGRFALNYDRSGFTMKGDGRVLGAPLTIDLRQPKPGAPGEALVSLVLDETLRAKKGFPVAPQLSGPIPARLTVPIGRPGPGKPPIRVEADLTKAGIEGLLPGWSKAAGKPGKLAFTLAENQSGGSDLRDIVLDASPALARGSAAITADGGFDRAEISSLKLSPGDDMRVSVDHSSGVYRVAVKGQVADARPFLKTLTSPDSKKGKDKDGKDVEADIALNILTGYNGEVLTNANLKLTMRDGDIRNAQVKGRFGSAPLTASIKPERGQPLLQVESDDSGATLRFFDVYKRMYGGKLDLSLFLNDGPQAGGVKVKNFVLRDEPALSRIMASSPAAGDAVDARGRRVAAASDVGFDRMRANFQRSGARISFSDAVISNAAMGFTMGGWLDTAKERTQIDGTFVPLYALNNVVAHVPIVGPLLAGDRNEGLFGVNFAVSGAIAKPTVSVNPLSAVAPGFLRQLFGAGRGGGSDASANGLPER